MSLTATNFDQQFSELTEASEQFKLACLNIAQDIEKKETTLHSLVEAAESYLISKHSENRSKGLAILATILEHLPRDVDVLNHGEMEYLCDFLINRLQDHHSVIPAVLKAISILIELKNFPKHMVVAILNGIFQNISCQTQQPKDRLVLYKIFSAILESSREEITIMGPDFVYGVMSSVENERNPQNLLYLFNWYPIFCKNVKLGHLTDDMFDILSCYFPVDFQPLNSQTGEISRNELANALSPGLYAIPEFADLCIILALEKLSSDLLVAKFDSLKLLMNGTKEFTAETYSAHSTDIISSIKRQIFEYDNAELNKLSGDTLTDISVKLSNCDVGKYEEIILNTYDMVQGNLRYSDKYFAASNLFLSAFAKGSKKSAEFILQKITQRCIEEYKSDDVNIKVATLKTVYIYTQISVNFDNVNEVLKDIETLFYNALISDNKIIQSEGFSCLALIARFLSKETKCKTLGILKIQVLNKKFKSTESFHKTAVLNCFESFARSYPADINKIIEENYENYEEHLELIGFLVKLNEYTESVMDIITKLCTQSLQSSIMAIKELRKIVCINSTDAKFQNKTITYLIQHRFVYKQILWTLNISEEIKIADHKDFLKDLLYVIQIIVGADSIENQLVLVDELLPRILKNIGDTSIILISSLLTKLKHEFDFNNDYLNYFVTLCFKENDTDEYLLQVSHELVANLLNKCKHDVDLDNYLNFITQFREIMAGTNIIRRNDYKFVALITKAIAMRGHSQTSFWINEMIGLLNTSDEIIEGFALILSDNIDSLSSKSGCTIRLFYKQRLFSEISRMFSSNTSNDSYLKAFCIMLTNISNKIFVSEFEMILPLILASMKTCTDTNALLSLLKMLQSTINQNKDIISGNIDEILTALVELFNFKYSMEIRILAIKCVEEFLNCYPFDKLNNQKDVILTALSFSIDDKKRLVRKVAADSRSKWFLYGQDY